jgi:hypothetical protein
VTFRYGEGVKSVLQSIWFHLVVIPGIFLLGRLSATVKITGFRAKKVSPRIKNLRNN